MSKQQLQGGISEAASENRPRRGRPPVWDAQLLEMAEYIKPQCGPRQRQNILYAQRALLVLGNGKDERFAWLADYESVMAGTGRLRWSLLAELGRIANDAKLIACALEICQEQPRAKRGARLIRNWRLGSSPGTVEGLRGAVSRTVADYLETHDGITLSHAAEVLRSVASAADRLAQPRQMRQEVYKT